MAPPLIAVLWQSGEAGGGNLAESNLSSETRGARVLLKSNC